MGSLRSSRHISSISLGYAPCIKPCQAVRTSHSPQKILGDLPRNRCIVDRDIARRHIERVDEDPWLMAISNYFTVIQIRALRCHTYLKISGNRGRTSYRMTRMISFEFDHSLHSLTSRHPSAMLAMDTRAVYLHRQSECRINAWTCSESVDSRVSPPARLGHRSSS